MLGICDTLQSLIPIQFILVRLVLAGGLLKFVGLAVDFVGHRYLNNAAPTILCLQGT